jgi:hypothetical protein
MAKKTLRASKSTLATIEQTVAANLGLTAKSIAKLKKLQAGKLKILGTIDQDFDIPIHAGVGKISQDKTTWGVTIKGYFKILSPPDGSWTLTVNDDTTLIGKFSGATVGNRYPFAYKTGFTLKLRLEAVWTKKLDTTLRIHLHATY